MHASAFDITGQCMHFLHGILSFKFVSDILLLQLLCYSIAQSFFRRCLWFGRTKTNKTYFSEVFLSAENTDRVFSWVPLVRVVLVLEHFIIKDLLAPNLPTPLFLWPLGGKVLSCLPFPSYFRIHWSTDAYIKEPFSPFYIKHLCLYYRYPESEKPSFELDFLDLR